MATQTLERLISSDDHVDLSHEDVKRHLTPKLHDDYDEAVQSFRSSVMSLVSSESNQRWRRQRAAGTHRCARAPPRHGRRWRVGVGYLL